MKLPDISRSINHLRNMFMDALAKRQFKKCDETIRYLNDLMPEDHKVILNIQKNESYRLQYFTWLANFEEELDKYRRDYMA